MHDQENNHFIRLNVKNFTQNYRVATKCISYKVYFLAKTLKFCICDAIKQNESEVIKYQILFFGICYLRII